MCDEEGCGEVRVFLDNERDTRYLEAGNWDLLVPLLVEDFGRVKMIYVRDLRATNFSLCGQKYFPPKHVKFRSLMLIESDSW